MDSYLIQVSPRFSDEVTHQFVIQTKLFECEVEEMMQRKFPKDRVAVRRTCVYTLEEFKKHS